MYVCDRYPICNSYVAAHRSTLLPMGSLADAELRHKRIQAHRAFDRLWRSGLMSKKEAYQWIQTEKHPAGFCRPAGCLLSVILFCSVSCYRELLLRLLYTPAPITPAANTASRANHTVRLLLSPVCGLDTVPVLEPLPEGPLVVFFVQCA